MTKIELDVIFPPGFLEQVESDGLLTVGRSLHIEKSHLSDLFFIHVISLFNVIKHCC